MLFTDIAQVDFNISSIARSTAKESRRIYEKSSRLWQTQGFHTVEKSYASTRDTDEERERERDSLVATRGPRSRHSVRVYERIRTRVYAG